MISEAQHFDLRLAASPGDLRSAQRLRYEVFVEEMGADGPLVDHDGKLEQDEFDPFFDHLILIDPTIDPATERHVVGVYRLMTGERAAAAGRFYSESEYDLARLKASGRRLLELGRSCVKSGLRGGTAMFHLWNGLAEYVLERDIEVMFGVASFHGTDLAALQMPLAYLHHHHLAPESLRVRAVADHFQPMNLLARDRIDRVTAMAATPALIKAYLRLGGFVGEGAYVDHGFNTTDVCVMMDTARMSAKHRAFYVRKHGAA